MKQSSLTMLKFLAQGKKSKLPKPAKTPALVIAVHPAVAIGDKPVNDPTDPNQLMESERTPLGNKPSKRVPVKLALPKSPIKPTK